MSEWWLPAGIAIAAVALTYFFCVRPMRRGHRASTGQTQNRGPEELDQALDRARHDLVQLRADAHQDAQVRSDVPLSTRDPVHEEEHR